MTRRISPAARRGATLVELTVTIAVLAIIASVAAIGIQRQPAPADTLASAVKTARRTAGERGRPVHVRRVEQGQRVELVAYPDGRVIADSAVKVDRLTGQYIEVAR